MIRKYSSSQIRRILLLRFSVAGSLLAAGIIFAFVSLQIQLKDNERFSDLINISGRQRMLSQRIALLIAVKDQAGLENSAGVQRKLTSAINLMETSQRKISQAINEVKSRGTRFQASEEIDALVKQYLVKAAAATAGRLQDPWNPTPNDELLFQLDQVVNSFQAESERRLAAFQKSQTIAMSATLLVLASVALLLFRPSISIVTRSFHLLEQANAELVEFSYRISHDLRSPVIASIGLSEISAEALDEGDFDTAKETIARTNRSLTRVSRTIEDIVGLVKTQINDVPVEEFSIESVVENCLIAARDMEGFDEIQFDLQSPKNSLVKARKVYLKQSIENLLSNAVKYRDPAKKKCVVRVSISRLEKDWLVSVTDNGLGIDPKYHDKVCGMFQRFHPTVSIGTGLGLYLVAKNASALGGSLSYQPLSDGSKFNLTFPSNGS